MSEAGPAASVRTRPAAPRPVLWLLGVVMIAGAVAVVVVATLAAGVAGPRAPAVESARANRIAGDDGRARATVVHRRPVAATAPVDDAGFAAPTQTRLDSTDPIDRVVEGVVFHRDGTPAAHAGVALGRQGVACDGHGRFRIECVPEIPDDASLVAFVPGVQPAVLERFGARLPPAGRAAIVGPVRLDLGPPALTVAGVVVDARGVAQKGWSIRLRPTDDGGALGRSLEELVATGPRTARTGRDGGFVLHGLRPRPYEILVCRRATRIVVSCDPNVQSRLRIEVPDDP